MYVSMIGSDEKNDLGISRKFIPGYSMMRALARKAAAARVPAGRAPRPFLRPRFRSQKATVRTGWRIPLRPPVPVSDLGDLGDLAALGLDEPEVLGALGKSWLKSFVAKAKRKLTPSKGVKKFFKKYGKTLLIIGAGAAAAAVLGPAAIAGVKKLAGFAKGLVKKGVPAPQAKEILEGKLKEQAAAQEITQLQAAQAAKETEGTAEPAFTEKIQAAIEAKKGELVQAQAQQISAAREAAAMPEVQERLQTVPAPAPAPARPPAPFVYPSTPIPAAVEYRAPEPAPSAEIIPFPSAAPAAEPEPEPAAEPEAPAEEPEPAAEGISSLAAAAAKKSLAKTFSETDKVFIKMKKNLTAARKRINKLPAKIQARALEGWHRVLDKYNRLILKDMASKEKFVAQYKTKKGVKIIKPFLGALGLEIYWSAEQRAIAAETQKYLNLLDRYPKAKTAAEKALIEREIEKISGKEPAGPRAPAIPAKGAGPSIMALLPWVAVAGVAYYAVKNRRKLLAGLKK